MDDNKKPIDAKFGSTNKVRWMDASNVTVHDSDGDEMHISCKCGKSATIFLIGSDSQVGRCFECAFGKKE